MEVTWDKVKLARQQGHNDKQILGHVYKNADQEMRPKIEKALKAGHSPEDILNHISNRPGIVQSTVASVGKGLVKAGTGLWNALSAITSPEWAASEFAGEESYEDMQKIKESAKKFKAEIPEKIKKFETGALERAAPSREGAFYEGTERLTGMLAMGAAKNPQQLIKTAIAAGAGQAAKEAGFGWFGQAVAEMGVLGFPTRGGEAFLPTKKQVPAVRLAKELAVNPKEIIPLIQSQAKLKWTAGIASKGPRMQAALERANVARKKMFENFANSKAAQKTLNSSQINSLESQITEKMRALPADLRKHVSRDISEFLYDSNHTGKDLMNLRSKIGKMTKIDNSFATLYEPIDNQLLSSFGQKFSKDYEVLRKVYKNYFDVSKVLSPSQESMLFKLGKVGYALKWLTSPTFTGATIPGAVYGVKALAREFLINPRLQNLSAQILIAVNQNKRALAVELAKQAEKVLEEEQKLKRKNELKQKV